MKKSLQYFIIDYAFLKSDKNVLTFLSRQYSATINIW